MATVPNVPSNRISAIFPDQDMQVYFGAIGVLQEKLKPKLVDLSTDERIGLPKMGPKTVDFVTRTLGYARAHPEFVPSVVDLDEFQRDLDAFHALRSLLQPLSELTDMLDDSVMLASSEAYSAALAAYQAFKSAAKLNHPGAEVIAADLSDRFPRRSSKPTPPPPAAGTPAA